MFTDYCINVIRLNFSISFFLITQFNTIFKVNCTVLYVSNQCSMASFGCGSVHSERVCSSVDVIAYDPYASNSG